MGEVTVVPSGKKTRFNSPMEMLLEGTYIKAREEIISRAVGGGSVGGRTIGIRKLSCPLKPLGQFPDPLPEEQNPSALFKRGWLRKGGGAFLLAPSGVGKSVLVMQAAISWELGKPLFGIEPVRPMSIAVIQAEDDQTEISFFRNSVTHGLVDEFGFDEKVIRDALGYDDVTTTRVFFHKAVGMCGMDFIEEVAALLREYPTVNLVIVNPFQSYFGGDANQNSALSEFFRRGLDVVIKDHEDEGKDRAAIMFVHHTNKPPGAKERDGWGVDQFAAYIGAGGAEIVNWARAIVSIMPTRVPGLFRMVAGKRGQRLGWVDVNSKPVYSKLAKHADEGRVYWRHGTEEDEQELREASVGKGGAVGGDGSGGRPPVRARVGSVLSAVSAVYAEPGMSGLVNDNYNYPLTTTTFTH
jgi:hypothetical protein